MITAGVDLSSQDRNTGICAIEWSDGKANVIDLRLDVADPVIVDLIGMVDKVGVDTPLGWPTAFAEAVAGHSKDGSWPNGYRHEDTTEFRLRRTDVWIWRDLGLPQPLSVSTDRIALPAMRAASLISSLAERMPLDGSGVVVEVYPAAALNRWGLTSRGYKGRLNQECRGDLVSEFRAFTNSWLTLSRFQEDLCRASDDAFDALIASLVARAAKKSLVEPIPRSELSFAVREGWIAIPLRDSLAKLCR
jgi:predicted nuclease with RNAse H fold